MEECLKGLNSDEKVYGIANGSLRYLSYNAPWC